MIQFECECGKKLQAKEELAGKRIRCPQCGNPTQVPSFGGSDDGGVLRVGDATASWEGDTSPRRGGCGRRLFGMLFLLIVFAAGGAAGWFGMNWFLSQQPAAEPSVLDLIPRNADAVVVIKLAELWNNPAAETLRKDSKASPQYQEFVKETGLEPGDVRYLALAAFELPDPAKIFSPDAVQKNTALWMLIETTKPYDKDVLLKSYAPKQKTKKFGDRVFYESESEKLKDAWLHFISDTILLVATEKGAEHFAKNSEAKGSGAMAEPLKRAPEQLVTVALRIPKVWADEAAKHAEAAEAFVGDLRPLLAAQSVSFAVAEKEDKFRLTASLHFADAADAQAAGKATTEAIEKGKQAVEQFFGNKQQDPIGQAVKTLTDSLTARHEASSVTIEARIDSQVVRDLFNKSVRVPVK